MRANAASFAENGAYGDAILMIGFTDLQRSLTTLAGRGNFGIDYEMKERLRAIGEKVAAAAPAFVPHKTGKRGGGEGGPLEGSVRVSVTTNRATVYSTAVYGGVQQHGGGPHTGWANRGPHVRSANASHWMSRAVRSMQGDVQAEVDALSDWVVTEFARL